MPDNINEEHHVALDKLIRRAGQTARVLGNHIGDLDESNKVGQEALLAVFVEAKGSLETVASYLEGLRWATQDYRVEIESSPHLALVSMRVDNPHQQEKCDDITRGAQ